MFIYKRQVTTLLHYVLLYRQPRKKLVSVCCWPDCTDKLHFIYVLQLFSSVAVGPSVCSYYSYVTTSLIGWSGVWHAMFYRTLTKSLNNLCTPRYGCSTGRLESSMTNSDSFDIRSHCPKKEINFFFNMINRFTFWKLIKFSLSKLGRKSNTLYHK